MSFAKWRPFCFGFIMFKSRQRVEKSSDIALITWFKRNRWKHSISTKCSDHEIVSQSLLSDDIFHVSYFILFERCSLWKASNEKVTKWSRFILYNLASDNHVGSERMIRFHDVYALLGHCMSVANKNQLRNETHIETKCWHHSCSEYDPSCFFYIANASQPDLTLQEDPVVRCSDNRSFRSICDSHCNTICN